MRALNCAVGTGRGSTCRSRGTHWTALDERIVPRIDPRTVISVQISALINRHRNQPIDARIELRSGYSVRINVQIKRDPMDGT